MLKLNKNSRNMCCALAVAAVFFVIVKCMKSEGYFGKKHGCKTYRNGMKLCSYGDGKWHSAKNTGIVGLGSIRIDKNVRSAGVCKGKCMSMKSDGKVCAGFQYNTKNKICKYKSADQIPTGPDGSKNLKKIKGSHVYVKMSHLRDN